MNENNMTFVDIPDIDGPSGDLDPDPFDGDPRISKLQARAWWFYVRHVVAGAMRLDDVHASPEQTCNWLAQNSALGRDWRNVDPKRPSQASLQDVHLTGMDQEKKGLGEAGRLCAAATIYRDGPDLSELWSVLGGTATDDHPVQRFLNLTGLTTVDFAEIKPEFLSTLLDAFEPISLHAVAAILNQHWGMLRLAAEERHDYLALCNPNSMPNTLKSSEEVPMKYRAWMHDRWFQCASICLNHGATIRQLTIYGLRRFDLFSATGQPASIMGGLGLSASQLQGEITMSVGAMPPGWRQPSFTKAVAPSNVVTIGQVALAWHRHLHGTKSGQ